MTLALYALFRSIFKNDFRLVVDSFGRYRRCPPAIDHNVSRTRLPHPLHAASFVISGNFGFNMC